MIASPAKVERILFFYRYAALSFTSLVYLLGYHGPPLPGRAGLVLASLLLTLSATRVYRRTPKDSFAFKGMIVAEMAGTALVILFTGGVGSPFLWCLLNPALIAASYLSAISCWGILYGFLLFVFSASYYLADPQTVTRKAVIQDAVPFLLLAFLMSLALQVFANIRKDSANAHARTDETMEHIACLYQIMGAAAHLESASMGRMFAEFARMLTKSEWAFFWDASEKDSPELIALGTGDPAAEEALALEIENRLDKLRLHDDDDLIDLAEHGLFLAAPVKSAERFTGVLGVKLRGTDSEEARRWKSRQILFLSDLCAVIVGKHQLTQIEKQLAIIEEQNRIADEMHDSVSQHLFGIVYAVHSLNRKWRDMSEEQLNEQLQLIQDSSQKASKELRSTIYSLSSRKNNGASWTGTITAHLERLSHLHGVEIRFDVQGEVHHLPVNHQTALYRMISEAVGNAIRHGVSSMITVEIRMLDRRVQLIIADNGKGFHVGEKLSHPKVTGLGIGNMQYLVKSFGGVMNIASSKGEGTRIAVGLPVGNSFQPGEHNRVLPDCQ